MIGTRWWLLLLLSVAASVAQAKDDKPPPDPTADSLLISAGFLTHHPDMKYRLLGMEAYKEKRHEDALRFFRRASFYADKPSQGMVAEMLWNGEGTPQDRPLAYAWMDLAAERAYAGFLGMRERYWNTLTREERTRALQLGEEVYARFGDAAAKPRYEAQLRRGRMQLTGSRTGFAGNVQILIPGPEGGQSIDGSKFYDERYWDAKKYWAYTDQVWAKPRIGRVSVGDAEQVNETEAVDSRIRETRPDLDAQEPDVPEEPVSLPGVIVPTKP
ncbi:hypothetical protein OVA13_13010 [Pseudoxanthomonas sp. SL93]|uniref:hypothetical protein n=1 Tax=Pseudoxanthomonas sp. SL93 TaxID=2995142 RepID=UPI00226E0B7A|nr:hypothetical protein [Pseudoxanthomonas sp. SL93]WAC62305.1 hypothetical protein OVA13_13010 [Pseudoxanthomonas sp. SL93]